MTRPSDPALDARGARGNGREEALAKARPAALSNTRGGSRAGRGELLGVALVLLGGVLALWIWSGSRPSGRGELAQSPGPGAPPGGPVELAPVAEPPSRRSEAQPPSDELAPFASAARTADGERFRGVGSIRGHIEVASEEPFPRRWQLVLAPSTTLPARERALPLTLTYEDGRQDFGVSDLPLGGYDVRAEAEGFNGPVQPVLLERGSEHPFVNLRLIPAGFLEGRIADAGGLPAEGVPVTLLTMPDGGERVTETDAAGVFRFERVTDGPYELLIGRLTSPVLPERRPLRFTAPSMTFPDIQLPPLGGLDLRVVDSLDRPIEGVRVRGSGTKGGLIEETSDADGRISVRHLPPGHYRIRLEHAQLGERRVAVDLEAGEIEEASLRLGS